MRAAVLPQPPHEPHALQHVSGTRACLLASLGPACARPFASFSVQLTTHFTAFRTLRPSAPHAPPACSKSADDAAIKTAQHGARLREAHAAVPALAVTWAATTPRNSGTNSNHSTALAAALRPTWCCRCGVDPRGESTDEPEPGSANQGRFHTRGQELHLWQAANAKQVLGRPRMRRGAAAPRSTHTLDMNAVTAPHPTQPIDRTPISHSHAGCHVNAAVTGLAMCKAARLLAQHSVRVATVAPTLNSSLLAMHSQQRASAACMQCMQCVKYSIKATARTGNRRRYREQLQVGAQISSAASTAAEHRRARGRAGVMNRCPGNALKNACRVAVVRAPACAAALAHSNNVPQSSPRHAQHAHVHARLKTGARVWQHAAPPGKPGKRVIRYRGGWYKRAACAHVRAAARACKAWPGQALMVQDQGRQLDKD